MTTLQQRARELLDETGMPDLELQAISAWTGDRETLSELAERILEHLDWRATPEKDMDDLQKAVRDAEHPEALEVKKAVLLVYQAVQSL